MATQSLSFFVFARPKPFGRGSKKAKIFFYIFCMINLYHFLAISIAMLHFMVAMYLLSLPFFMLRKQIPVWYTNVHLIIFSIAAGFHFTSGVCPLTFAENYCRSQTNLPTYQGNFLNHYAETFFHFSIPNVLVSNAIIVLAGLLVVVLFRKYYYGKRVQASQI